MNKLMTSVSGVRGVFADTLNPIIAIKYAAHFALIQKRHYPEENLILSLEEIVAQPDKLCCIAYFCHHKCGL